MVKLVVYFSGAAVSGMRSYRIEAFGVTPGDGSSTSITIGRGRVLPQDENTLSDLARYLVFKYRKDVIKAVGPDAFKYDGPNSICGISAIETDR